jgi:tetraacyldisaccharide 4'-kinase
LIAHAGRESLTLVTTEKDMARLQTPGNATSWVNEIVPFAVTLEFDDIAQLRKLVTDRLFQARGNKIRRGN